jgi:enoyl-CoA hydratase/carnithine racemase
MRSTPYEPADLVDGVLTIRLMGVSKPATSQANGSMDISGLEKLLAVLEFARFDEAIHVIVLRVEDDRLIGGLGTTASAEQELISQFVQALRHMPQPIVAMAHGQVAETTQAILDACDIVFADDDWATLSFPLAELEAQTYKLANELAAKDPLALRFTKKTVQQVASVPWDGILHYTTAQQAEIKSLQAGQPSARAKAIESFLAGKSKPGAGT